MKKITIVLTITALAAALFNSPVHAQSLTNIIAKDYDDTLATAAITATQSPDEQSLFAAVNAQRVAEGESALTWDPALAAAARYQTADELKYHFVGAFAYLADEVTQVQPAQMAADFGSPATAVAESEFGNGSFQSHTGNWPALVTDWRQNYPAFAQMLGTASVNTAGLSLVDTGSVTSAGVHIYLWVILYGTEGTQTAPTPPASGPTLNVSSLDPTLAKQALATGATLSATEQNLLAQINYNRSRQGWPALTVDATLEEAAHYQGADEIKLNYLLPNAYQADGKTVVNGATLASDFASPDTKVQDFVFSNSENSTTLIVSTLPAVTGVLKEIVIWANLDKSGFSTMLNSGAYNVCGVAVEATGLSAKASNGTVVPITKWTFLVGHH